MVTKEVWRHVVGYRGVYMVSDMGRVLSLPRRRVTHLGGEFMSIPKILRQTPDRDGYLTVNLCVNSVRRKTRVHRAVLTAFHGDAPGAKHQSAHLNGVPSDNRATNLKWATAVENASHKKIHGTGSHPNMGCFQRAKTHCVNGHQYSEENTYRDKHGYRSCRVCLRATRVRCYKPVAGFIKCADRTHCPSGHEYDEANTHVYSNGHRACKTCVRRRRSARTEAARNAKRGGRPVR